MKKLALFILLAVAVGCKKSDIAPCTITVNDSSLELVACYGEPSWKSREFIYGITFDYWLYDERGLSIVIRDGVVSEIKRIEK